VKELRVIEDESALAGESAAEENIHVEQCPFYTCRMASHGSWNDHTRVLIVFAVKGTERA
jgi:hypothetical protein